MSKRDKLANHLSGLRDELTVKQHELSALVVQPGANTSNAGKVNRLVEDIQTRRDEVERLEAEIVAIDQAAYFEKLKAQSRSLSPQAVELSRRRDNLTSQRDKLTSDLERVRVNLADKLDQLSPGALVRGGDALRLVSAVKDLRAQESILLSSIEFINAALGESAKQINQANYQSAMTGGHRS